MSHFRPKRRVRRVVHSLSLMLATPMLAFRATWAPPYPDIWQPRARFRTLVPRHLFLWWQRGARWVRSSLRQQRLLAVLGGVIVFTVGVSEGDRASDSTVTAASSTSPDAMRAAVNRGQQLAFYDPADTPAAGMSPDGAETPLPVRPQRLEVKPLPWAIPESVFFLYKAAGSDLPGTARSPIATAFVLSVPERKHGGSRRFLVTARHVVDPQWAHCSETNPASIDLRLNRWSGGVGYARIPLRMAQRARFLTPVDPTADLAAVPLDRSLIPNLDEFKFIDVPFSLLPTNTEAQQFHADQPVMTARIPLGRPARSGSFPVFDAGLLAGMPSGAVDVQCGASQSTSPASTPLHVWFIHAGLPQGTSGAPVYTSVARGAEGRKTPVLLGIQSVAWPDRGLAGITPAFVLRDMMESVLRENEVATDSYKGLRPLL